MPSQSNVRTQRGTECEHKAGEVRNRKHEDQPHAWCFGVAPLISSFRDHPSNRPAACASMV